MIFNWWKHVNRDQYFLNGLISWKLQDFFSNAWKLELIDGNALFTWRKESCSKKRKWFFFFLDCQYRNLLAFFWSSEFTSTSLHNRGGWTLETIQIIHWEKPKQSELSKKVFMSEMSASEITGATFIPKKYQTIPNF